jgi:hypothetical protein
VRELFLWFDAQAEEGFCPRQLIRRQVMQVDNTEIRPLGEELSMFRELSTDEVSEVSGGVSKSCSAKITGSNEGVDGEAGCTIDF